ncbi:hypothetical protein M569_06956 [Genlisea aurea]|uniref:RNase H type-1 domain-containing protein n=1 Tax=Genlisea aurea TaxID=192259 RepID=S8E610_9LAMI|nr:hypothetical protein M569_06956 [Genlisea aurea]
MCGSRSETWWHLFVDCDFATAVWRLGNLPYSLFTQVEDSPCSWLTRCMKLCTQNQFRAVLISLWMIWLHRNEISADSRRNSTAATQRWQTPSPGWFKLNFDSGSLRAGTGFGGLIRDANGVCHGWFTDCSSVRLDPEQGEYIAARKVLELAISLGCTRVILEGDCLNLIQAVQGVDSMLDSSIGLLLRDLQLLLSSFQEYRVQHIPRNGNAAAHALAKKGIGTNMVLTYRHFHGSYWRYPLT